MNIIRLDRQHFLEYVSRTMRLKYPDFHFTNSLTTHLSFTTQRLLRHQGVWPCGTSMRLILNHVTQFQDVVDTNHRFLVVGFTCLAII
ncbi:hypothetical protein SDC9_84069 [bioreactor metagenome]|uniref:Uncharacterized protein n=1 Tax=bioreactor metagenome TaxID=1076179 RepID=A0A644Z9F3_9ZZZZ